MAQVRRDPPFGLATTANRHLIAKGPATALTTADLKPGEFGLIVDSVNENVHIQVRYPGGALVCGTIALASQ